MNEAAEGFFAVLGVQEGVEDEAVPDFIDLVCRTDRFFGLGATLEELGEFVEALFGLLVCQIVLLCEIVLDPLRNSDQRCIHGSSYAVKV